jgi:methionyl-tRNA synthetase
MKLWEKKEIVRRTYSGWYCTPCERFWTEKDLKERTCPDCGREVEHIEEDNYFFLMSRYQDRLIRHIEEHPQYILPETRKNEVMGFLRSQPLADLCISRPRHRLSWGVPLPFDENYVTYVWFDALINYYSAASYLAPEVVGTWWPATHHIIGKDILTTHAVYWSAMLMALEMPLPENIFAHGWWTIEGRKMSKSLGNVVDAGEMAGKYGSDAFRYFLFREVPFGLDGDFSEAALIHRTNTDLANDLGNLASRVFKMTDRYFQSTVPLPAEPGEEEQAMRDTAQSILHHVEGHLRTLQFQRALEDIWKLVSLTNKYIDTNSPWLLAKDPEKEARLRTVIYSSLEALRFLALYLHPFLPVATQKLYAALSLEGSLSEKNISEDMGWGGLKPGERLRELEALFPRIEQEKKTPRRKEHATGGGKHAQEKEKEGSENVITIQDFASVEIKTGKVTSAERIKGSKKLIRLEVDTGEPRQVVAGIGAVYAPEDLEGKSIVVVTNLKPAKLMGVESQGMLLAATDGDGNPIILTTEKDVPPGLRIK